MTDKEFLKYMQEYPSFRKQELTYSRKPAKVSHKYKRNNIYRNKAIK